MKNPSQKKQYPEPLFYMDWSQTYELFSKILTIANVKDTKTITIAGTDMQ